MSNNGGSLKLVRASDLPWHPPPKKVNRKWAESGQAYALLDKHGSCRKHHSTVKAFVECAFKGWAIWVSGGTLKGPTARWAVLAWCPSLPETDHSLTITLHNNEEAALNSIRLIDSDACGNGCHNDHDLLKLDQWLQGSPAGPGPRWGQGSSTKDRNLLWARCEEEKHPFVWVDKKTIKVDMGTTLHDLPSDVANSLLEMVPLKKNSEMHFPGSEIVQAVLVNRRSELLEAAPKWSALAFRVCVECEQGVRTCPRCARKTERGKEPRMASAYEATVQIYKNEHGVTLITDATTIDSFHASIAKLAKDNDFSEADWGRLLPEINKVENTLNNFTSKGAEQRRLLIAGQSMPAPIDMVFSTGPGLPSVELSSNGETATV